MIPVIGHGYVGAALVARLHEEGREVVAVNRSVDEKTDYPLLEGDVSSAESMSRLADSLVGMPTAIVHCASSSRGGADAYRAVFLDGIANLQALFPGVPIFFTSSTSVYGQTDRSVVTEESETSPDRETSRILVEAETLVRDGGGVALRLAGIYGPGRSIYQKRILEGTAKIEAGEVSRHVNQIHREDIIGGILHAIDSGEKGVCYNVVDNTPLTQREVYEKLSDFFQKPHPPEAEPEKNRKRAWTDKIVSNAAFRATGWEPQFPSFLDALKRDESFVPSVQALVEGG